MGDQKKILYSILKEVKEKDNEPTWNDYGITKDEFGHVVEMAINEKLISNAHVSRGGIGNKVQIIWLNNAQITLKGLNYLEENSILAKTYKGLKEARDWVTAFIP